MSSSFGACSEDLSVLNGAQAQINSLVVQAEGSFQSERCQGIFVHKSEVKMKLGDQFDDLFLYYQKL